MINSMRVEVDPRISILAGYEYGREIWNTQCSLDDVNINENYYLVLPAQIEGMASNFVNGFFQEIIEKIGAEKAAERLCINNKELEEDVKASILLNA